MRSLFLVASLAAILHGQVPVAPADRPLELDTARYRHVAHLIEASVWDVMRPAHQRMLANLAARGVDRSKPPVAFCMTGNVPDAVRLAFERAVYGDPQLELQLLRRWTQTATNPSVPSPGSPITLTYSFVPDGTFIPGGAGEPSGPSDLIATFDAAFPSRQVWQDLYAQVFARWGALTGINYVLEPNDDGVAIGSAPGVRGVRGDLRMSGHRIDGGSGILAYNPFPPDGDMVMDTADVGLYANPNNNYRFIRNTLAHEHGHGMGILHVCPREQTKLMEPFISTQFDGPQLDDRLSSQRFYGDTFEPNETPGQASDLGNLNLGTTTVREVSIDAVTDTDVWSFTAPAGREVTIRMRPVGASYREGPQTGSCGTQGTTIIDTQAFNDLAVELIDSDGTTVIQRADLQGAGSTEEISSVFLPSGAGTYYVRVLPGPTDQIQAYELDVVLVVGVPPAFDIEFPNGVPTTVTPDLESDIGIRVQGLAGAVDPASGRLRYTPVGGGVVVDVPITWLGGDAFVATLPPIPCQSSVSWWVEFTELGGTATITAPGSAPSNRFSTVGIGADVFSDTFDTFRGWAISNSATLTDGAWELGVPAGGGTRGDPATADGGSGGAYVTDNAPGNSDVDGGSTFLASPVLDLSQSGDPTIEVAIWYDNDFGNNPGSDTFEIEISGDGGANWTTVESYNASVNTWVQRSYRVLNFLPALTNQVRMRFVASDLGGGSVVEAGVDSFRVVSCAPGNPGPVLSSPCADGTFSIPGQGATDLLGVNFSTGGEERRVDVGLTEPIAIQLGNPVAAPTPFLLAGRIGVPTAGELFDLGGGLGALCFAPEVADPANGTLFTVVDSIGGLAPGGAVFGGAPAPFVGNLPPLGIAAEFTLQAAFLTGGGSVVLSNALIIRVQ